MRNIAEPLYEVETIINHNMEIIHKLAEIANTSFKDNPQVQRILGDAVSYLWFYLKPVHIWIRDQNPAQKEFYDLLDTHLKEQENRSLEVKDLVSGKKKGKK